MVGKTDPLTKIGAYNERLSDTMCVGTVKV